MGVVKKVPCIYQMNHKRRVLLSLGAIIVDSKSREGSVSGFHYQNNEFYVESLPIRKLAEEYGTPLYAYSGNTIKSSYMRYANALSNRFHKICYSVKANANLSILKMLADMGAGFDIVSSGELERVLTVGGDPNKIVFSGVGKQPQEIRAAILENIFCFNVESEEELNCIQQEASKLGYIANIALRVNPNIDAGAHPHIMTGLEDSKFGIAWDSALKVYKKAASLSNVSVIGIASHIGSQILDVAPMLSAVDKLLELVNQLHNIGIVLKHIDIGGGLGIAYKDEIAPSIEEYLSLVCEKLGTKSLELIVEPGRSIIAHAGVLLTKVELIKQTKNKKFSVVDASMTDNIRTALYGAWHKIEPVISCDDLAQKQQYDIVGAVCETADYLGKNRMLALHKGDLLVIRDTGAYGIVMASNYNCRNRPAEVLVVHNQVALIRRRETIKDQLQFEKPFVSF